MASGLEGLARAGTAQRVNGVSAGPDAAPPESLAFGRALSLQQLPACPELRLWLIDEDVDLELECAALAEHVAPPYWAFCWGAGQLLARFLLDHPEQVRGRRVLDLGTGSGVVAVAAARAGAAAVCAVDSDVDALSAARANALANGVSIRAQQEVPDDWDLLVASDVFFEAGPRDFCRAMAAAGRDVLVCEPDRPGLRHPQQAPLSRAAAFTHPDVDSPTATAAIYRLTAADQKLRP